ncbi:MAG: DUF4124 domain-containing protein [Alteromonadaceae bacterium]|nr:DUF4124 domain-containing protein [Alteromonadaceae bacterium]
MKCCLFTLFTLVFSNITFSSDMTIYRWVDENKIVHFSQNQPNTGNYTQLSAAKMKIEKPNLNILAKKELPSEDKNFNDSSSKNSSESNNAQDNEKSKCLAARKNLKTLQDFDSIKYKTLAGDFKVLTTKEKKAQLAFNKTQIELYCT